MRNIFAASALSLVLALSACTANPAPTTPDAPKEPAAINIYLARHGKTMLNTADRSQGWIDAPLTPAGKAVAEDLGKGLSDVSFDAVYSSDSGRAVETANLALENAGQAELLNSLVEDSRLREFNFGTFEGMPNQEMWAAIAKQQGKSLKEFMAGMATDGFVATISGFAKSLHDMDAEKLAALGEENGVPADQVSWQAEDFDTVVTRAKAALDDIVAAAKEKGQDDVLVTSHGMTIAALVASLDPSAQIPPTGLKNASISKVVYKDGKFTVESVNDLSYVEAGAAK